MRRRQTTKNTTQKTKKMRNTESTKKKKGAVPVTYKKPALLLIIVKSGKGLVSDGGMNKITSLHLIWPISALMFLAQEKFCFNINSQ